MRAGHEEVFSLSCEFGSSNGKGVRVLHVNYGCPGCVQRRAVKVMCSGKGKLSWKKEQSNGARRVLVLRQSTPIKQ